MAVELATTADSVAEKRRLAGASCSSNLPELAVGPCGADVRYAVRYRRRVGRGTNAVGDDNA